MNKRERIEAQRAEKFAPINPAMSARMLAALHRCAGSRRSQDEIEAVIGRLGLWSFLTESNRAYCGVTIREG